MLWSQHHLQGLERSFEVDSGRLIIVVLVLDHLYGEPATEMSDVAKGDFLKPHWLALRMDGQYSSMSNFKLVAKRLCELQL